jgi:triphosphatase
VRQSGQRFVQTVKAELGDDPLRRGEWEASVPSLTPDVGLAMPFVPAKLRDELRSQPLQPVFTSDIHRFQRIVDLPSGTVEVAFDRGVLRSADRSLPVSEIELELKEGSASAIYDLALQLADHGLVRPSTRSKAARGFDLATDAPPLAKKPRKLDPDPALPLDDAFASILESCLRDLLVSVPAAEDGRDPEGVHQVRVALRRLRSALDSMATVVNSNNLAILRSDAQWLAATLSAARTWDIFRGETLPTVAAGCPAIAGFDVLAKGAEEKRLAAYGDARSAGASDRSARFVIRLGGWIVTRGWRDGIGPEILTQLAEPASSFAKRVLSLHHEKMLKRGRHFRALTAPERHRVRLAAKKLRYAADFLLPLATDRKAARLFTGKLAELQDQLGAFNDIASTSSLLASLVAAAAEGGTAAAAITGWQAHAMAGGEARLTDAWRGFAKTRPPWIPPPTS